MNEEKPLKKSYFAKKRHFYLFHYIDYQCSNNFKKKKGGYLGWCGFNICSKPKFSSFVFSIY